MNNVTTNGRLAAVSEAPLAAGFADVAASPNTATATATMLTAATQRATVLVRIVPQHSSDRFTTQIHVTCRRHNGCRWRTHLGDDVPTQVIATATRAARSAPMPYETRHYAT